MLQNVGNALLRIGDALLTACCCGRDRFKACVPSEDECGNSVIVCVDSETGTPFCPPACAEPPEPCDCGPDKQCETCYECVDRKCVRIEDCCADGTPCPACSTCIDGQCVPCDEIPCTQCVGGSCSPCGPCQKCEDGECSPCDSDEVCINGVCVPKQYYCCWDSCEAQDLGSGTTCKDAKIENGQQVNPCGTGTRTGGGSCDLKKSGPYSRKDKANATDTTACEANCGGWECIPDACGIPRCVQTGDGPYETESECQAACGDPCSGPSSFNGSQAPGVFAIDACERDICISYSSTKGRPIFIQIWGPIMVDGCAQPGTRVIKAVKGWNCDECCDCPDTPPRSNNPGPCEHGPAGTMNWTKPTGMTWFEVAVLAACGAQATYEIDIQSEDPNAWPPRECKKADGPECGTAPDETYLTPPCCECPQGTCENACQCCEVCVKPCDPECVWPQNKFQWMDPVCPCCAATFTIPGFPPPNPDNWRRARAQEYLGIIPFAFQDAGTTWKPGAPASLQGCDWRIVFDSAFAYCDWPNCDPENPDPECFRSYRLEMAVLVLSCGDDGPSLKDITDRVIDGPTTLTFEDRPECKGPNDECPGDADIPDFFPYPEPACDP